ncbi:MAG: hypothetical protein CVU95_02160 [Firmicutes bacterium HGW-Firmicutes-2]|nr:MAG: hypothetical protein CVU95_02160 [Firmicutes bacterium HGW-Firmicutes-2]
MMRRNYNMSKSWIYATVIALMSTLFFVDQDLGISVFMTTVLTVAAIWHFKKEAKLPIGKDYFYLSGYVIILSLNFAVTTVDVIRVLSALLLIGLVMTLSYSHLTFKWPTYLVESMNHYIGALSNFFKYFNHGSKAYSKHASIFKQIGIGMIIALPILLVASALMTSADAAFGELMHQSFEILEMDVIWDTIERVVVFIIIACFFYGLSIYLIRSTQIKMEKTEVTSAPVVNHEVIPVLVGGTVLLLLNLLYLIFAYVQIRFLFLAQSTELLKNYDYASYAREGFFELLVLSILNTLGVLFVKKFVKSSLVIRIGLTVTVFCTYIMVASSFYKMYLYESMYGYTRLRLYVYLILLFMAIFMSLIALGIWRPHYKVIEWGIMVGLVYYLVISFVNIDGMIVRNNLRQFEETGNLDLYYLTTLSEDGMPDLIEYMNMYGESMETDIAMQAYEGRLLDIILNEEDRWFFEYNHRYSKSMALAKEAKKQLFPFSVAPSDY